MGTRSRKSARAPTPRRDLRKTLAASARVIESRPLRARLMSAERFSGPRAIGLREPRFNASRPGTHPCSQVPAKAIRLRHFGEWSTQDRFGHGNSATAQMNRQCRSGFRPSRTGRDRGIPQTDRLAGDRAGLSSSRRVLIDGRHAPPREANSRRIAPGVYDLPGTVPPGRPFTPRRVALSCRCWSGIKKS